MSCDTCGLTCISITFGQCPRKDDQVMFVLKLDAHNINHTHSSNLRNIMEILSSYEEHRTEGIIVTI